MFLSNCYSSPQISNNFSCSSEISSSVDLDGLCTIINTKNELADSVISTRTTSVKTLVSFSCDFLGSIQSRATLNDIENISSDRTTQCPRFKNSYALELLEDAKLIDDVKYYKPTFQLAEHIIMEIFDDVKMILSKRNINFDSGMKSYPNIIWPTQAEFNIFVGLERIDKYISTWVLHPDWKYIIDLKKINEYPFTKEYIYEANFSCPSKQFPVAQATASVYFFIGVSFCNPLNSFVDVMFMVESAGSKFYPGHIPFNQKWLELVIDSKVNFFKQICL